MSCSITQECCSYCSSNQESNSFSQSNKSVSSKCNTYCESSSNTCSFQGTHRCTIRKPTIADTKTLYITSSYEFDDSSCRWCLQATNLKAGAKFTMRPCAGKSKQKFYYDDLNQIRIRNSSTLCMQWKKKKLFVGECSDSTTTNKTNFVIDESAGTITVSKKNADFLVCVRPLNRFEKVRLYKSTGNVNDSCRAWSLQLGV